MKKEGNTIMLITVVGVVFITLAVVLFSVGNFKCARVLVPIIAVAMSMGIWKSWMLWVKRVNLNRFRMMKLWATLIYIGVAF